MHDAVIVAKDGEGRSRIVETVDVTPAKGALAGTGGGCSAACSSAGRSAIAGVARRRRRRRPLRQARRPRPRGRLGASRWPTGSTPTARRCCSWSSRASAPRSIEELKRFEGTGEVAYTTLPEGTKADIEAALVGLVSDRAPPTSSTPRGGRTSTASTTSSPGPGARRRCGATRPTQLWAVTRHADVLDVERRDEVFSSEGCYRALLSPGEANMIAKDDPQHLAQRRLVNRRFTPRAVQEHRAAAARASSTSSSTRRRRARRARGRAASSPPSSRSRLTAHLLGFPEELWPDLKSWSERLMRTDAITRDPQAGVDMLNAIHGVQRRAPGGRPGAAGVPGRRPRLDVGRRRLRRPVSSCTRPGCSSPAAPRRPAPPSPAGLRVFVDHPDQWEAMAADPSLVPGAVEELIRWVTPLNNMFRMRASPTTTSATSRCRPATGCMLAYPSANRDEAVFDDPFRFDVRRSPEPPPRLRPRHALLPRRQPGPARAPRCCSRRSRSGGPTCGS